MKRSVSFLALIVALALALPGATLADDPPAPVQRHVYRVAGLPPSGPMEVVTFINEFQPGAQTPAHTHPGLTLVTVIEGAVTFRHPDREQTYRVGDSFVERPGEVGIATNTTATRTRVIASMIVPKGAPPSTPQPGAATPPLTPTLVYLYRTDAIVPAGDYDVAQQVLDFAPGAQTPVHTHPGQVVVTVIAGENTFITAGKTTVYKTGDSFVELPGVIGQARNAGSAPMAVMATFLLPKGEPLSHPAATPGLPNTGGGGLARTNAPLVPVFLGIGALGGVWLLRRRVSRARRSRHA
ncbi:MAG TPA: cupin domain-containing protein [Thermomicrobiales bacterium]